MRFSRYGGLSIVRVSAPFNHFIHLLKQLMTESAIVGGAIGTAGVALFLAGDQFAEDSAFTSRYRYSNPS